MKTKMRDVSSVQSEKHLLPEALLIRYNTLSNLLCPEAFHKKIGIPWEYVFSEIGYSRTGFLKHRSSILKETQPNLISIYDKAVKKHDDCHLSNPLGKIWSRCRNEYQTFYNEYLMLTQQIQVLASACSRDDDSYCQLLNTVDNLNRVTLLEMIKPAFYHLNKGQALKLATHFAGYAFLARFPFIGCISIMTPTAQKVLKGNIDAMYSTTAEQFSRLSLYSNEIPHCTAIRYKDFSKARTSLDTSWKKFEKESNNCHFSDLLKIAALLFFFNITGDVSLELELLISYSLFLNETQQGDALSLAKSMLTSENTRTAYNTYALELLFSADNINSIESILKEYYGIELIQMI